MRIPHPHGLQTEEAEPTLGAMFLDSYHHYLCLLRRHIQMENTSSAKSCEASDGWRKQILRELLLYFTRHFYKAQAYFTKDLSAEFTRASVLRELLHSN